MMKIFHKAPFILLLTGIALSIAGCGARTANQSDKLLVVSILPLKYVVENITGQAFPIDVLVPTGASPETYEPTPAQMMAVSKADLIFVTGLIDFEQQLTAKIAEQGAHDKVIDLSAGIDLIQGDCGHATARSHGHGVDPHIWSSPKNLKKMAGTVYRSIALLYPDSIRYRDNYERFVAHLDSLDVTLSDITTNCESKYFIIYHPALTYLARDYGIAQVSLEDEGKEPSADKLKRIISEARKDGIAKIFYQKQFSPATVETIAREMGATCVEIDPLREDVDENLVYITRAITSK